MPSPEQPGTGVKSAARWKQYKPALQSLSRSQSPSHRLHPPAPHPETPLTPEKSEGGGGGGDGEGGGGEGDGGGGGGEGDGMQ